MNLKDRLIVEEFIRERENFVELSNIVYQLLDDLVRENKILTTGIEYRVKQEQSLKGKLYKNGDYYQSLSDITDIFGARVICYFVDDVKKIGKLIEDNFDIDWENSSDKRDLIKANAFGYLSLHYICSLKKGKGYSESLTSKRFEIQIRTILQHAWAAIEHDLGYKTEFGVPRTAVRQFARLAGLLELADDEFVRTRDNIKSYTEEIRDRIINDNAENVNIDVISLKEYMLRNKKMRWFLEKLASIEGSEITENEPDNYIEQLKWLKIDTIGKLQEALAKNKDVALKLATRALKGSELDILASNVALRFVCQAEIITNGYTEEQAVEFTLLSAKSRERAQRQVKRLFNLKKEFNL